MPDLSVTETRDVEEASNDMISEAILSTQAIDVCCKQQRHDKHNNE